MTEIELSKIGIYIITWDEVYYIWVHIPLYNKTDGKTDSLLHSTRESAIKNANEYWDHLPTMDIGSPE